jgi:hypothetical protein
MAQPEDRSHAPEPSPTPSEVDPDGATLARYDADDNLDIDSGDVPHNAGLDSQHGRKTRQARKDEISNRRV